VFRELHGLLGEGKDQFHSGLFVNLHLINAPLDFGPERILERLKVFIRRLFRVVQRGGMLVCVRSCLVLCVFSTLIVSC
jgi:hypothetical protein